MRKKHIWHRCIEPVWFTMCSKPPINGSSLKKIHYAHWLLWLDFMLRPHFLCKNLSEMIHKKPIFFSQGLNEPKNVVKSSPNVQGGTPMTFRTEVFPGKISSFIQENLSNELCQAKIFLGWKCQKSWIAYGWISYNVQKKKETWTLSAIAIGSVIITLLLWI